MNDSMLSATHVRNLHLLRNYLSEVQFTLRHLHGVAGAELSDLTRTLDKTSGRQPQKNPQPAQMPSLEDQIYQQLLGKFLGGSQRSNVLYRLSKGQIMSDIASSISRTIRRDL